MEKDFIIWKYSVSHYKTNLNEKFKRFPSIDCCLSGLQRQLSQQRCPDRPLPCLTTSLTSCPGIDQSSLFPTICLLKGKDVSGLKETLLISQLINWYIFFTTRYAWSAFFNFLASNIVSNSHTLMGNNVGFSILLWYADLRKLRTWGSEPRTFHTVDNQLHLSVHSHTTFTT